MISHEAQDPQPSSAQRALAWARGAWGLARPAVAGAWHVVRPVLKGALEFLLALIVVFEEWGWRPLAELLGWFARWRPWAILETYVVRLPPYVALVVFVLPTTLLLPLKLIAVFLVAQGHYMLAALLFAFAKVVATALVGRLFMLTQPALMQIGWFASGYDTVIPWKDALVARVRASWAWRVGRLWKERARRVVEAAWRRWRPAFMQMKIVLAANAAAALARGGQLVRDLRARWLAR